MDYFCEKASQAYRTRDQRILPLIPRCQIPPEVDSKGQEIGQEALQTEDVNKLYLTIAESLNQADVKDATVIRGDDYTYVSFANSVFFGANSSVLTLEGQKVLYSFAKAIAPAAGGNRTDQHYVSHCESNR